MGIDADITFDNDGNVVYSSRHGGPWDRGAADAYYSRPYAPHYFKGDSLTSPRVEMQFMTPAEITAYTVGYRDNEDKKS